MQCMFLFKENTLLLQCQQECKQKISICNMVTVGRNKFRNRKNSIIEVWFDIMWNVCSPHTFTYSHIQEVHENYVSSFWQKTNRVFFWKKCIYIYLSIYIYISIHFSIHIWYALRLLYVWSCEFCSWWYFSELIKKENYKFILSNYPLTLLIFALLCQQRKFIYDFFFYIFNLIKRFFNKKCDSNRSSFQHISGSLLNFVMLYLCHPTFTCAELQLNFSYTTHNMKLLYWLNLWCSKLHVAKDFINVHTNIHLFFLQTKIICRFMLLTGKFCTKYWASSKVQFMVIIYCISD